MSAFAIYRLPHEDHATLIRQASDDPLEIYSLPELNGKHGFVVAPFEVKADQPVLLIQGNTELVPLSAQNQYSGVSKFPSSCDEGQGVEERNNVPSSFYSIDFANYHSQLEADSFRKIVLARCADERLGEGIEPMELFYRACEMYPRLFIVLVDTPQSGCWLTATPEILLDGNSLMARANRSHGALRISRNSVSSPHISQSVSNSLPLIFVKKVLVPSVQPILFTYAAILPSNLLIMRILVICCRLFIPHQLSVDFLSVRHSISSSETNIHHDVIIVVLWDL